MSEKKDLVEIIKANPGCCVVVDNDNWRLFKAHPRTAPEFENYEQEQAWYDANLLARDGEVIPLGDGGYGTGCAYAGDVLQALAKIVGIEIESV